MSAKLANAPIFYTAAQIKFNPVLNMGDSINTLQSAWRQKFPDFSQQLLNQLQLAAPNNSEEPKIQHTVLRRWHFKDIQRKSGLILTNDSLVFQTAEYATSAQFIDTLVKALKDVHDSVSLAFVEAVSFRSLDAIVPTTDHDLGFFLQQQLLGLYPMLEGSLNHSVLELVLNQGSIQLASRSVVLNGKLGIPADLFPLPLTLNKRLTEIDGLHAVLDNDAVRAERFVFDLEEVYARLREVKSSISQAFYKAVTENALTFWNSVQSVSSSH